MHCFPFWGKKSTKNNLKQILGLIVSYFEAFSATKGCQKQFYIQKRLYKYLLKYFFKDLSTLYPIGPIYNPAIYRPPWRALSSSHNCETIRPVSSYSYLQIESLNDIYSIICNALGWRRSPEGVGSVGIVRT